MIRNIIKIDSKKCIGCGICASACHEGAIGMVNGKAVLLSDNYCDGLGNCLPVCPTKAITFEQREAVAYNKDVAPKRVATVGEQPLACGCPGTESKMLKSQQVHNKPVAAAQTELRQWPVQIKLAPVNAPYFNDANLLVAADCVAYAYGNFHNDFMKNKITVIGCPKLDSGDYSEKLTEIIKNNSIKSVTVVRMQVPCCGGIEHSVKNALQNSGKFIPWQVVTISTDGNIIQ